MSSNPRLHSWMDALNTPFNQQIAALGAAGLLAFLFPAGLLLALVWSPFRTALQAASLRAMAERKTWTLLLIVVPLTAVAFAHPSPPDDLLRDLHAWRVGYDYRLQYWGSPGIQKGDYYLGFDHVVGWLDRTFDVLGWPQWSWAPVVALDMLGWSVALVLVLRRLMRTSGDLPWMVWVSVILLLWLTPNFSGRPLTGRPESFFALWAFCALAVDSVATLSLWVLAGLALSCSYWFFWIYVPSAALLFPAWGMQRRAWVRRVGAAAVIGAFGMAFWLVASHGQYFEWFLHLQAALHNRVFPVGENQRLILGTAIPSVMALAILAITASASSRMLPAEDRYVILAITALAAWFALPNMVRYTDIVVPLAAAAVVILADRKWQDQAVPTPWASSAALMLLGLFMWTGITLGTQARPLDDLSLPQALPGQRVLSWYGQASYDFLYLNPDLRLAPAFELGFSRKDVQIASHNLGQGKISCTWLHQHAVSWVIAPAAPIHTDVWNRCLHLERMTSMGTSIWRVKPVSEPSGSRPSSAGGPSTSPR